MDNVSQQSFQEITERITRLHSEVLASFKIGLDRAIEIGYLLTHAKKKVIPFGQFGEFCRKLPFSERTCQNYMRVYDNRKLIKNEGLADLNVIYEFLKTSLTATTEMSSTSEDKTITLASKTPRENTEETINVKVSEISQTPVETINITTLDGSDPNNYVKWHKNQTKTNAINNRALELCLALERQPLENIQKHDEGWLAANLKLVFEAIFSFIAKGKGDNNGDYTYTLLTQWLTEAKKSYLSEKSRVETQEEKDKAIEVAVT